ncbi:MBL fold metallo-hydrolase [Flavobacterium sp. ACN6]|uniref:MBL fold metallo-hydrolase n=1 Tax=Flavobacterium sp. ACN6 TaxID=1920426 RepID=UPI000BB36B4B|nr:MBL fold metallo-hydrolase [Flavobacterium sp. ACN6]PBJ04604.1 Beta-lactamase type II precursor [Flavobacterium sp. ACN6]
MKKLNIISVVLFCQLLTFCAKKSDIEDKQVIKATTNKNSTNKDLPILYQSDNMIIRKVSTNIYEHTSFLQTHDAGKVSCNGMIVVSEGEAVIFDTPASDQSSVELLDYLTDHMNWMIKAIVATDWHSDALGGLAVFHRYGVNSYASTQTIKLASDNKLVVPMQGFKDNLVLNVGKKKVFIEYLIKGQSSGSIVVYFPEDKVIFGGCLIKALGTKKESMDYINKKAWLEAISAIRKKYPDLKKVIPGHGKLGGPELLDYTMDMVM